MDSTSVNELANPLVEDLYRVADGLRLKVSRTDGGTRIIDAGIAAPGGMEAGRRIAEICMAGLGREYKELESIVKLYRNLLRVYADLIP